MLKQSTHTFKAFNEKISPSIEKEIGGASAALAIDDLAEAGIPVSIVQLYDNYTRDHVIKENAFVGFGLMYLKDDLRCYGVFESDSNGLRSAKHTESLFLTKDSEYPFDIFLYNLIIEEDALDHIWTVKNENDPEIIKHMIQLKYPEKEYVSSR